MPGAFAAEVLARPSATFLRLAALAPAGLPAPGSYSGRSETSGASAACRGRVREATLDEARAAIGWYAPANDFGVHDFRWADRGSNVLSKGHDGYTPIGPAVVAGEVDAAKLRLRTRVNGTVVQDASTDELLFG